MRMRCKAVGIDHSRRMTLWRFLPRLWRCNRQGHDWTYYGGYTDTRQTPEGWTTTDHPSTYRVCWWCWTYQPPT